MTTEDQGRTTGEEQPTSSSKHINAPDAQIGVLGDHAHVEGGIHFNVVQTTQPQPVIDAQERRNLGILLDKVKSFWIKGVLEKSVHAEVMLELGKTREAEAVEHPWGRVLELPNRESRSVPSGTKISALFAEMGRAMLILGEPGSGKTITLLELARELIEQWEADENFSQPVPVVFNLSSWQKGLPLLGWLKSELSTKYQIPKKMGRVWLESHRLLPLLDGLDEVRAENRTACVEALNAFADEYGLAGLVVCSRLAEYTALPVRLKLNGAIRLQPLTMEEVEVYLIQAGSQLDSLRSALQEDEPLRELAESPLMLNVMSLAYRNRTVGAEESLRTVEARREHMFTAYIEQMFMRRGKREGWYSDEQTLKWLTWLSYTTHQQDQVVFLVERIQPDWLSEYRLQRLYSWGVMLFTLIPVGVLVGLGGGLPIGFAFPHIGRIFGIGIGLATMLAIWSAIRQDYSLSKALLVGLTFGLAFAVTFGLAFGLSVGLAVGSSLGWVG